jgi:hypothetical protein
MRKRWALAGPAVLVAAITRATTACARKPSIAAAHVRQRAVVNAITTRGDKP